MSMRSPTGSVGGGTPASSARMERSSPAAVGGGALVVPTGSPAVGGTPAGSARGGTPAGGPLRGGTPPDATPRVGTTGKRMSKMTMGTQSAPLVGGFQAGPTGSAHLLSAEARARSSRAEYGYLLLTRADSRNRVFGVPMDMGTFNIADRSVSAAGRTSNPQGDYEPFQRGPPAREREEDRWPKPVRGGFIFDRIERHEDGEFFRKSGALMPDRGHQNIGRNIIGNCTVKDQYHTYYGSDSTHYGHHVGTTNVHPVHGYKKRI